LGKLFVHPSLKEQRAAGYIQDFVPRLLVFSGLHYPHSKVYKLPFICLGFFFFQFDGC
jgi:hypothetical protein